MEQLDSISDYKKMVCSLTKMFHEKSKDFDILKNRFDNLEKNYYEVIDENKYLKLKLNFKPKDVISTEDTDIESVIFTEENFEFNENDLNEESRANDEVQVSPNRPVNVPNPENLEFDEDDLNDESRAINEVQVSPNRPVNVPNPEISNQKKRKVDSSESTDSRDSREEQRCTRVLRANRGKISKFVPPSFAPKKKPNKCKICHNKTNVHSVTCKK